MVGPRSSTGFVSLVSLMKNQHFFTVVADCRARADDNAKFMEQKTESAHRIGESKRADYGGGLGKIWDYFKNFVKKSKFHKKLRPILWLHESYYIVSQKQ